MPRSALIVDDSRTALAALSRLLKEQGVAADTVESGPEALNFLRSNNPGVIFLDHMMPGMDGFETLAALKSDARTAAIPVVMYTSREGDAYMGQAQVLGAFGVLQKPVNPDELEQILKRIDQLRTSPAAPGEAARSMTDQRAAPVPSGEAPPTLRAAVTGVTQVAPEFRARPETSPGPATTRAHSRSSGDVVAEGGVPAGARPWGPFLWRALLALVLLLPGAWYFERYQQAERLRTQIQHENLELRAEQRAARESAESRARESSPPRADLATPQRRSPQESRGLLDTITWALNQHGQYGFGDEPLGDTRLAQLRELIARLTAAGFQGTVRLETHIGEFCLVRDETGSQRLPHDGLSIDRCEVVTYPPAQAVQLGQRQSPAFARFLAERRPGNPIQITVVSHGANRPLATYPDMASVQTAGDWNQVARVNQRVEITLLPAP
jgi:CheY-like chemotaxis protein